MMLDAPRAYVDRDLVPAALMIVSTLVGSDPGGQGWSNIMATSAASVTKAITKSRTR